MVRPLSAAGARVVAGGGFTDAVFEEAVHATRVRGTTRSTVRDRQIGADRTRARLASLAHEILGGGDLRRVRLAGRERLEAGEEGLRQPAGLAELRPLGVVREGDLVLGRDALVGEELVGRGLAVERREPV